MFNLPNGKITPAQILFPVALVAFVVFLMLGFQLTQIMRDRQSMNEAMAAQEKPIEEVRKVQEQLNALAIGTQKLADNGNKPAKAIIERMNQMGITVNPNAPGAAAPQPTSGIQPASAPGGSPAGAPGRTPPPAPTR
ncbi:MAG: hypothetical protein AB7H77_08830 [Bdellovibrionales bacterium]